MTEQEYMIYTDNLRKKTLNPSNPAFEHGVIGMAAEAGELLDIHKSQIDYGKPVDKEHVLEEMGDLFHYMTYIMKLYGWTVEDLITHNVNKLNKRYPNGYSDQDALARKDKCLENAPQD